MSYVLSHAAHSILKLSHRAITLASSFAVRHHGQLLRQHAHQTSGNLQLLPLPCGCYSHRSWNLCPPQGLNEISLLRPEAIPPLKCPKFQMGDYLNYFDDSYVNASVLFIILGAIVLILGFFGCCGACTENSCMMFTFATLLAIVVIAEVVMMCYASSAFLPKLYN